MYIVNCLGWTQRDTFLPPLGSAGFCGLYRKQARGWNTLRRKDRVAMLA